VFKNFITPAYRNLIRNKAFSAINISGLAIGMASAILILLWVQNELSYDRFYKNSDRLYQSWIRGSGKNGIGCSPVTPKPLGPALKQEYPEVEQMSRVNWDEAMLLTVGEKRMNITGSMVDPGFLAMFGFPMIYGNANTALSNPTGIVITEKLSRKLFDSEDAMGKTIRVDDKYDFAVSGVMKDLPGNTMFDFEYLLPWSHMQTTHQDDSSWNANSTHNFILLKPNTDAAAFNKKIQDIIVKHIDHGTSTTQSFLYPVSRLRLYSNFVNGVPSGGRIATVRVFILIAIFILVIACINFMNMSTASSEKRAKEVGIRKVAGARVAGLIWQFLGESMLIVLLAGMLAVVIVLLTLPAFNTLTGKQIVLHLNRIDFLIYFAGFVLFTGLLAGSYPAFFLSSFKPAAVLKGTFKKANALVTPRKVLVILQFTFAITMIVCTLIIKRQIKYAQEREAGYDKSDLIYIFLSGDMEKNYQLIRNDLIGNGIATAMSKTSAPLTEGWNSGSASWEGKSPNDRTDFNYYNSDGNLVKTAGLQLVQGRDIDLKNFPTDSTAAILNESAVKAMGFKHPIGQIINRGSYNADWHVIGVVKDFILQSPYEPIKPMVIQGPTANWFNLYHIKLNPARGTAINLAGVKLVFKKYNPDYPFEYHFIDEAYAKKFNDEQTTGVLTGFFAGLTIFISCLGLFGLATYMASSRVKEIGVRKVLGASVLNITALLSRDFIRLIIIAILISTPIAWWSMTKWLSDYNYKINISGWIFIEAGLVSILIALFTVSFQSIRAALCNPVTTLRSE
jgi:putative ABC transport system permease protein